MAHRKSPARIAKDARIARLRALATQQAARNATGAALTWDAVAALEARLVGRVVLPTSPDYDTARRESNPAFQA